MTEDLKDLHEELRNAMRREAPPAGFAERVLKRVAEQTQDARTWGPPLGGPIRVKPDPTMKTRLPFVQWAAAALLVAAVAGGFHYVAKQEQRAEGEAARERVVLALHIAGSKLQLVQTKINRLHEPREKNSNQ